MAEAEITQGQVAPVQAGDPRALRSHEALIEAMLALIDAMPVRDITISRVVETAGVTRPTFYRNFTDTADAARQAAMARLQAAFPPDPPCLDPETADREILRGQVLERSIRPLEHLRTCRVFYTRVLDDAATVSFFQALVAFLAARLMADALSSGAGGRDDYRTLIAGGIMWLVIDWLRSGAEDPPEMARRLADVAQTLVAKDRAPVQNAPVCSRS